MTVLEQRFMERVPNLLRDISKSLETIAAVKSAEERKKVYVVTFLNDCEWELPNVSVNVFATEEEARKCLDDEWQMLTSGQEYDEEVSKINDDDFLFEDSRANRTIGEIKECEVKL